MDLKCAEVKWCSIDNWYQLFRKVTFKTIVLPIPNEVLDYLKSDGSLILPKECNSEENEEEEEEENNESSQPSFPRFNAQIKAALDDLGGAVFPKLNWSAPRDASWVGVGHSLKCESLTQIWLLLKSSDFVCHDLTQPFKDCVDQESNQDTNYVLALKKWSKDINPATEFRCYIKQKDLICIEQRDASNFYKHIADEKEDIVRDIHSFFHEHVKGRLNGIDNLVMDVSRPSKDVIKLIDFNPFGITTDTALIDWNELEDMQVTNSVQHPSQIDFRFVQSQCGIRPNSLNQYSVPKDIVDLACGNDHDKLVDFLKLQADIQEKEG